MGCGGTVEGSVPAAPTGAVATPGNAEATISWNAVSGANSYNLYWSTTSGVIGTKITGATSPYVQAGLSNGTTYYYVITAVNENGESSASAQVSAQPAAPPPPAAPTGVVATPGNAEATISWNAVSGANSYNLYWSTTSGVIGTKITGATSPYVQAGLSNGTTYYYVITAVNENGESSASAQVSAIPMAPPPAAPTAVTATAGNAQVTVSWNAVSGATSYNLYWSTTPGVTPANGNRIIAATSAYLHTGLSNGTTYYYVVTALNANGESTASVQASAQPNPPPAAPTAVTATAGNAQVTVSWIAVSGAISYNLYWSTTPGVTASGTKIAGATSPYVQVGLTNGTTYYYVVTAVNAIGESTASAQASAQPAANPPPAAPTGVTAIPGNAQATISWNSASGATSYNLYWSTSPGVTPANGTRILGATSPYNQTGLTNGLTYYYVVTAVNANGESGASAQVSAQPAANSPPAAPAGVTATPGSALVMISWSAASGATSYNVYWSTSPGVTPANGTKIAGATSPYVQTGLTNGTTYYYVVTAVNAIGESAASAQASAQPTAPTPPTAPTGVTATPGNAQVTISWAAVAGATSYNLYWSTVIGVTTANGSKIAGVINPYVHTGLINGLTYYYVATALNAYGESNASTQASAQPMVPPPPAAPTGVTATPGNAQVTVSWNSVSGATSYNIYWSTAAGVTTGNGTKITGATSPYVQTGLANGTTYYYVVTALNANESTASAQVSAQPVVTSFTSVNPMPLPAAATQALQGIVSGAPSIVQDQKPGAAGDLLMPVFGNDGYWYLFASQDGGQSWAYIRAPSASVGTHTGGICQDTVNYNLHLVTNSNADTTNIYYSRLALTRDSNGHVTGWTWDAQQVLIGAAPTDEDATDVRFQIIEAVDGLGNKGLAVAYLYAPAAFSSTLAMRKTTVAAGVSPAATADFVGLDGGATETMVTTTPVDTSTACGGSPWWNIHDMLIGLAQHPVTHVLYVFRGPAGNPAACSGVANQQSVILWRYTADAADANFTLASSTAGETLSAGTASQTAHWGGTFPTQDSIWICFVSPSGPQFDRVTSEGTYHASVLPNPDTTGSNAGYLSMAVNAAQTGAWATWVGTGDGYTDTWSGHWNGSAWDNVTRVSTLDMSGFGSSLYWRGGLAVVERSDHGVIEASPPDFTYEGQLQVIRASP